MDKALQAQVESALDDRILTTTAVAGGTINTTWLLDTQRIGLSILRIAPASSDSAYPSWLSPFGLRREQHAFELLRDTLGDLLPRTLAFHSSDDRNAGDWVVQTPMPGVLASTVLFKWKRSVQLSFWEQYGELVASIHAVSGSWFGAVSNGDQFATWEDLVRNDVRQFCADLAGNTQQPSPEGTILPAIDAEFAAIPPTLIHSDLGLHHIFVNPATAEISGVIDFEYARFSDPVAESVLWTVLKLPELAHHQAFLKGYGAYSASESRMKVAGLLGYFWDVTNQERLDRNRLR